MTAYNVVRMRVKPDREEEFLARNSEVDPPAMKGLKKISLVKTGDLSYCLVGEWENTDAIAGASPIMISALDTFRDTLEDLGGELGVTDAISGEVVLEGQGPVSVDD